MTATERRVAAALAVAIVAAVALAVVYVAGGQPQLEGALLALALGSLGVAVVLWAKHLFPPEEVTADRPPLGSGDHERAAFAADFTRGEREFTRRTVLTRLLGGALGALGVAALFPLRSLGPSPGDALRRTHWRAGVRVVAEDGRPVRVGDLDVGGVLTVFPQGAPHAEDSATVLVRVEPGRLRLSDERRGWAPEGHVAYSKICTHVGCPVGLYQETTHTLLCPCHQSTFDVLDEARPVFGPATRSLPQLPLDVDTEGYLVARSDYTEPVGPAFWNRDRR